MVIVNKDNFKSEVLESNKTVLVDFYADWCGPCKMIAPILEKIDIENENVKVCKVNVDLEEELAKNHMIMSIPALVVYKDGEIINKSVGLISKSEIEKLIK